MILKAKFYNAMYIISNVILTNTNNAYIVILLFKLDLYGCLMPPVEL